MSGGGGVWDAVAAERGDGGGKGLACGKVSGVVGRFVGQGTYEER